MKKIILTISPFVIALMAHGQSISPDVVASAGTHFTGGGAQLSWTIGEPLITTVSNGGNTITQGFHQTMLSVTSVDELTVAGIDVTVFPNPTSEILNIQLKNNKESLQLNLFDLNGKLLQTRKIAAEESTLQINMDQYAMANYVLRIYSADASVNYTYKVQKMSAK